MSHGPSIRSTLRRGSRLEAGLKGALGAGALALAIGYALTLLALVVRGAAKMAAFTTYATPTNGIDNEEAMRFVVAACIFGAAGWGL